MDLILYLGAIIAGYIVGSAVRSKKLRWHGPERFRLWP